MTRPESPNMPVRTLIDDLLEEQQQLTAVDRFSRKHEQAGGPAQARYYHDLIPIRKPATGEQYAFAVDLDACTGCKGCVSACHSLNGLDEDEIWRNVGLIHGGTIAEPYQQTVTTACHHCVDPACLSGCPVMAYEKDPATGIVRHLDDQCIGCEYCMLKCPYEVPKYSKKRGIVRKCDMCYNRLAADEAPACVQACPNEAITIRIATAAEIRSQSQPGAQLINGAFDSSYTKPTTAYTSAKAIPSNASSGDIHRLRLEHPHWPLIWMLLFSQLSAGAFVCLALASFLPMFSSIAAPLSIAGFLTLQAGLIVSVFHLGHPLKAWRFFLGLRTSWMSREILVFSAFAAVSGATTFASLFYLKETPLVLDWLASRAGPFGSLIEKVPVAFLASATPFLAALTAFIAVAGIVCSAMIYVDTRRPFWSASMTFPKFLGTALLLGGGATAALLCGMKSSSESLASIAPFASAATLAIAAILAAWEALVFLGSLHHPAAPAHRSTRTMWQLLRPQLALRTVFTGAALILGAGSLLTGGVASALCATGFFSLSFASSLIERFCFFTASDAPRMPGGIAS